MSMCDYNYSTPDDKVIDALMNSTDKTFMRVYKENPPIYRQDILIKAIHLATIGKISFLLKEIKDINKVHILMAAVHRADISILELLNEYGYVKPSDDPLLEEYLFDPMQHAVIDGKVEIITYLCSVGYSLTESLMCLACDIRDANIIQYLIDNKCPRCDIECYISLTGDLYMKRDYQLDSSVNGNTYKCAKLLHDGGCEGAWGCKDNLCLFCISNRIEAMSDIWILLSNEYDSILQWLPREMLEDVAFLTELKK